MCGIIGYVGPRECKHLLLYGLERLEYRGYDSAGIALLEESGLEYTRAVGNLQNLKLAAGDSSSPATTGLGHTRGECVARQRQELARLRVRSRPHDRHAAPGQRQPREHAAVFAEPLSRTAVMGKLAVEIRHDALLPIRFRLCDDAGGVTNP